MQQKQDQELTVQMSLILILMLKDSIHVQEKDI